MLFLSAILHELGHGYMAYRLGDTTAKDAGRLTMNPLKHIDPFGTILLPILLRLAGFIPLIIFKPVPVNPANFKNPNKDGILVALAGPGTNLLLVLLMVGITRLLGVMDAGQGTAVYLVIKKLVAPFFILVNLILALFNLIPFPPLDGSWVLKGLLPVSMRYYLEKYNTYLMILFLILVLTGRINFLFRFILKFFYSIIGTLIG